MGACIEEAKKKQDKKVAAKACAGTVTSELVEMNVKQKDIPIYLANAQMREIKKLKEQLNVGSEESISSIKKKCKDL